uniref:Uncharacterized protein n=1 Tax=Micrurus lemniscatus lemniscatus TaxID=129467 RepID=A0A2D4IF21_MICLE
MYVLEKDEQRLPDKLKFPSREQGVGINELAQGNINLVQNFGRFIDKIFNGIQVVESDEQKVPGSRAEENLVFESHSHQIIKLIHTGGIQSHDGGMNQPLKNCP